MVIVLEIIARFNVRYCSGNLEALQQEICKGNPVIVMIKVRKDKNWLHYVPVVGFNDRYIFIAESLLELVNCDCGFYNRRVEKRNFCSFGIRQCSGSHYTKIHIL